MPEAEVTVVEAVDGAVMAVAEVITVAVAGVVVVDMPDTLFTGDTLITGIILTMEIIRTTTATYLLLRMA
jgi:hypothetical protein